MSVAFDPYQQWLGIPPSEQPPHYYRLLGIELFESNPEVIARAADQRIAHVTMFQATRQSSQSDAILKEIAAGRLVLLDPGKKERYDRRLRRAFLYRSKEFWQRLATAGAAATLCGAILAVVFAMNKSEDARQEGRTGRVAGRLRPAGQLRQSPGEQGTPRERFPVEQRSTMEDPVSSTRNELSDAGTIRQKQPGTRPESATGIAGGTAGVSPPPAGRVADDRAGRSELKATRRSAAEPASMSRPLPNATASPLGAEAATSRTVYLDDLKEVDFGVGWGTLGKNGMTGYPRDRSEYGEKVVFKGAVQTRAISMHPPSNGSSYVVYNLNRDFRVFKATAAMLEVNKAGAATLKANPLFAGKASSPLRFRVFGDGKMLWQSRPISQCGDSQLCRVDIDDVVLLELQVECRGYNAFAWAAWIGARVLK